MLAPLDMVYMYTLEMLIVKGLGDFLFGRRGSRSRIIALWLSLLDCGNLGTLCLTAQGV